jgi:hypothetical protein
MSSIKIYAVLALLATLCFIGLVTLQVLEIQYYKPLV